jgi:hypothetical protein
VVDRDEAEMRSIVDGVTVARAGLAPLGSCAAPNQPLALSPGLDRYLGEIDEVRIYRGALPTSWFETEHANLTDPAFLSFGAAESRP